MCVKTEQLGLVLLGAGIGLLVSFALCGWFLRVLVAIILIVLGLLLLKRTYPCPAPRIDIPEHTRS